jgi:LPP20 lipoprotein
MKKIFFSLFSSLFLFCTFLVAQPSWYGTIDSKPHEIIGYGEGGSAKEARAAAMEEIASRLKVRVDSSFESNTTVKNKEVSSAQQARLKVGSNIILYGAKKLEEGQMGGKWYAAYSYDNRPFAQRFVSKFGQKACAGKSNQPLEHSPLFAMLVGDLKCAPQIELARGDGVYKLVTGGDAMVIDEETLAATLFAHANPSVSITPSKAQVLDGEDISLAVKSVTAGFVTIFDVYSDGRVSLMLGNYPQKANSAWKFPDSVMAGKELSLSAEGANAMDMFVVVLSPTKLDISRFEHASATLASQAAYNYDELLRLMKKYQAASTLVKVISAK